MVLFSFPRAERLLNRKDFVNLNRLGKRRYTAHFVIIFRKNNLGITRLGITASKKTGNSVKRNRIKRLIREFYRLHKAFFPKGYDIIIATITSAKTLDYWSLKEELGPAFFDKKFPV